MQAGHSTGKSAVSAARAAEMKGPSSREERPETTGSRVLSSGSTCRGQGGCSAVDQSILRPVGLHGNSELGRPVASGEEADSSRLKGIRGGHQKMVPWGAGENALGPRDGPQDGLMQDPAQLQGQQGKRQQMVLNGCGGEAEEECCGEDSRNGGAAANAAANGEPVRQRLPMVAAISRRKKHVRMAPTVRSGGTDNRSEESSYSEGADLDGGAAACAAAIEAVNYELRELQDRTVELVLERRRLEGVMDGIHGDMQEAVNEEYQRQAALGAVMQDQLDAEMTWQDAVNGAEMQYHWQDAVNEEVLLTVSNLATEVTEDILCDTFGQIGVVVGVSMLERCDPDGWPSGQVQFQDAEEAAEAQQRFDGVELCERPMSVRATMPEEVWKLAGEEV